MIAVTAARVIASEKEIVVAVAVGAEISIAMTVALVEDPRVIVMRVALARRAIAAKADVALVIVGAMVAVENSAAMMIATAARVLKSVRRSRISLRKSSLIRVPSKRWRR